MPKKLPKNRRVRKAPKKKAFWFSKLFTFPRVTLSAFIILSTLTFYQISLPSADVKGASTASYDIISDTQYETLKNSPSSVGNYPRYVNFRIWIDDGDAKREDNETKCPEKSYTVTVNGAEHTIKQKPNCKFTSVKVSECNKIVFTSKLQNYILTGIEYTDKSGNTHSLKGAKKISFCGGQFFDGGWARQVSFGLKPK